MAGDVVTVVRCQWSPQRHEIPGAEKQIPGRRLYLSTGNACDVTPVFKHDGAGEEKTALVFYWLRDPVPAEEEAALAYLRAMGLGPNFEPDPVAWRPH